jgi:protein-S-isoprenylcysteine O-methyltransferase Ste14
MSVFDSPTTERRVAAQLAYGALFTIALPLALAAWAMTLDARLDLPVIDHPRAAMALVALGALLALAAVIDLRVKASGWPMSPFPPKRLVISGAYAIVANPLYIGATLIVFGAAMLAKSAAGVWIVAPLFAAMCAAFVWGFEAERTTELFGERASPPLIHLPDASEEAPSVSDRLSIFVIVLLPWLVIYQAINLLRQPHDAISTVTPWDLRIPLIGWTELIYVLAYPIVLIAPLVARTKADLRTLAIRAWVATGASAICYLVIPTIAPTRPVPPHTPFAPLLEWERSFEAANTALPAFHVIWVMIAMRRFRWPATLAIAASCLTTGMHTIVDVIAGLLLGAIVLRIESVWRALLSAAQWFAGSWRETRIGAMRLINHGVYAALGVAAGIVLTTALAGEGFRGTILFIGASIIVGAALWAQLVEGSAVLSRPYGYYGGMIGCLAAITITRSGLLLLAAYSVASPLVSALGRIRCLVQGCCHGRPVQHAIGIRVSHPRSRVVRVAGLGGVELHATALYSIVANAVIGILLLRLWIAGAPLAFIAGSYFILSGLERFVEEHFRGEPQTRVIAGLRMYQWLSIASVIVGAIITVLPSFGAPAMHAVSLTTIAIAIASACVAYFAYGADFPDSQRRFSRLA